MVKHGYAFTYISGGAQYGGLNREHFEKLEAEAKRKKIGVWSLKTVEKPGDYKKRIKAGGGITTTTTTTTASEADITDGGKGKKAEATVTQTPPRPLEKGSVQVK